MVHEGIAEADPELLIGGIAPASVAQDSNRIFRLAVPGERLGHQEPRFLGAEVAEESMASLRQRHDLAFVAALRWRTWEIRLPLQRVARCSKEQCRGRGLQQATAHAEQPHR